MNPLEVIIVYPDGLPTQQDLIDRQNYVKDIKVLNTGVPIRTINDSANVVPPNGTLPTHVTVSP